MVLSGSQPGWFSEVLILDGSRWFLTSVVLRDSQLVWFSVVHNVYVSKPRWFLTWVVLSGSQPGWFTKTYTLNYTFFWRELRRDSFMAFTVWTCGYHYPPFTGLLRQIGPPAMRCREFTAVNLQRRSRYFQSTWAH